MKKLLLILLAAVLFPLIASADTIVLKNGMRFESEKVWEEDDEIKCYRDGLVVGFPKDDVERIEKTSSEAMEPKAPSTAQRAEHDNEEGQIRDEQKGAVAILTPPAEQRSELNIDANKQRFTQIQQELNLEYQTLRKEHEQLETTQKALKPSSKTINFDESVLRYNQKVKLYEGKRKTFNNDIEAYKAQIEKESHNRLSDNEKFTIFIGSWQNRPMDDFIDQWGYPNQIIHMPDGSRQYLFVIEITPLFSREILFITNSSGEINEFRMDVEKTGNQSQ